MRSIVRSRALASTRSVRAPSNDAAAARVTSTRARDGSRPTRVMSRRYVSTTHDARTRARDRGRADRVSSRVSLRARASERTSERSISRGTDRTHLDRPTDRRTTTSDDDDRETDDDGRDLVCSFPASQTARGSAIDAAGWVRTKRRSRPSRRSGRRTRAPVRKRRSSTDERWTPAATDGGGSSESVATGERGDGTEGRGRCERERERAGAAGGGRRTHARHLGRGSSRETRGEERADANGTSASRARRWNVRHGTVDVR